MVPWAPLSLVGASRLEGFAHINRRLLRWEAASVRVIHPTARALAVIHSLFLPCSRLLASVGVVVDWTVGLLLASFSW